MQLTSPISRLYATIDMIGEYQAEATPGSQRDSPGVDIADVIRLTAIHSKNKLTDASTPTLRNPITITGTARIREVSKGIGNPFQPLVRY
jgi:hypothetical protein